MPRRWRGAVAASPPLVTQQIFVIDIVRIMGDSGYLAAANPCLSGDLSGAGERSSGSYYLATAALISSARAFAAVTAEMAAWRKPFSSRAETPAIVVPPGEQT